MSKASFDIEADGDLDLVLAAETGPPVVLRNNSDGTFTQSKLFSEINGLKDFATGDIDEDGDADIVPLGPGAGTRRDRDGDGAEVSNGVNGHAAEEDTKWQRTG